MDIRVFTKILKEPHFTDYQKLRRYSQRIARMLKHPSFVISVYLSNIAQTRSLPQEPCPGYSKQSVTIPQIPKQSFSFSYNGHTKILSIDGRKRNGSLLYTILPIEEAVRKNYEMQMQKNAEIIAAEQFQKRINEQDSRKQ